MHHRTEPDHAADAPRHALPSGIRAALRRDHPEGGPDILPYSGRMPMAGGIEPQNPALVSDELRDVAQRRTDPVPSLVEATAQLIQSPGMSELLK